MPASCTARVLLGGLIAVTVLRTAALSPAQQPTATLRPNLPPVLLQMSRDPAVWKELKLRPQQVAAVERILTEVDGRWWRSRNAPPAAQAAELQILTASVRRELPRALEQSQLERLWQLERQALGTRMLLMDEVAASLALDPSVRQRLSEIAAETDERAAELQQLHSQDREEKSDAAPAAQQLKELQDQERQQVLKQLSIAQQQQIGALAGEPFDFGKIRRTLPRAPELLDEDGSWLQGNPAMRRLADLRGKVVAVHFYAFQCINCKRNLPHYQNWHREYADEGLVVIGVQTPETSAERDADKVQEAMKAEGIEYPVLLDTASSNWQNWGTTMWPTVYLVDRDGYIRAWWQGELNWEGATGEQQLRQQIERLLAETATAPGAGTASAVTRP